MEIHGVIIYSRSELILLHETSPRSPVNLQNVKSFDLLQHINTNAHELYFVHENFIIFNGDFSIIFCHTNSTVLFCEKLRNLFITVLKSVIKLKLTPIVLSNHIDLCYDVLRRMFQFGKIHEIDPNKLISSTLFNPKNYAIQSTPKISIFSDMFSKRLATDVATLPEICCTIHEDLRFMVKNGKGERIY
jgi:hypothetical protein